MPGIRNKTVALPVLVLILALNGLDVQAQSRFQVELRSVGRLGDPGQRGASRYFGAYSYGAGGLAKPAAASRGPSVLGSSIADRASYSVRRTTGRTGGSFGVGVMQQAAGARRKNPIAKRIGMAGGAGLTQTLGLKHSDTLGAAAAYMSSFHSSADTALAATDEPITSLAPGDDSLYSQFLSKGEKAFREGDFEQAYRQFRMANLIDTKDPESLLSLAHAAFAKSIYSYAEAALHLQRALKYFPELPLTPLRPKAFFGTDPEGVGRYTSKIIRLEDYVADNPEDLDARLWLVYFRWFEGQTDKAVEILKQSARLARNANDTKAIEAFDIFIDAVEAHKVLTAERPATQPGGGTK